MAIYGSDVIKSRSFLTYWNSTHFYCGKWGSMRFYEGSLYQRLVVSERYACRYYFAGKGIDEFNSPDGNLTSTGGVLRLPFYKHKNPPHSFFQIRKHFMTTAVRRTTLGQGRDNGSTK